MLREAWRVLVGRPLETERASHERLGPFGGLAVFATDALSSSAYATEEVLHVLVMAGVAAMSLALPIALGIVALLAIVAASYYQTIHAYPDGGGAYIVSKENLGDRYALVAAAALLVDYVLTVAVSLSAGTAAITSAVPALLPYRVILALLMVAGITLVNLRGVRESASVFAGPTYFFLGTMAILLLAGFWRIAAAPVAPHDPLQHVDTRHVSLWLVLQAFAAGCAALTGVEAVANGVPAFHKPEARNATRVLVLMVSLLAALFAGITFLAVKFEVGPLPDQTVISQIASRLVGRGGLYYAVQVATAMVLLLAANTAFADFPRLAALVGRDGYLPRQLANLGDRLVFTNGILVLGALAATLLVLFHAETHLLIPLYMVGVFISFTLSQSGMVVHWLRLKPQRWQALAAMNGLGAVATAVVGLVVAVVKFTEGAWLTLFVIGAFMAVMASIQRHYRLVARELSVARLSHPPAAFVHHEIVLPLASVHRGVLEALRYARVLGGRVQGLYIEVNPEATARMEADWAKWVPDLPLRVIRSPYRSVVTPIVDFIDELLAESPPETVVTVVIPEFVPRRKRHLILHNQTALGLKFALLQRRNQRQRVKVIADVPFFLRH